MARALTSGAGAGSAIALLLLLRLLLLLLLLHAFDRADRDHHYLLERCLQGAGDWQLDWFSLVFGFIASCLIYPFLEALLAYRWLILESFLHRMFNLCLGPLITGEPLGLYEPGSQSFEVGNFRVERRTGHVAFGFF